ncbi:hypothetical protein GTP58_20145 [Duganella sp. CY15W]|uniref:hypothetical protein n=1 Tax=Duganella sp. CY15W TaxID=2692172 RepID=UPI0013722674|nr:hypothetical protein [Duganella sp. CY15W]MYM30647.1 hypothetical protein [Duganella sp. CY15W]
MHVADIELLEGKALCRAFFQASYPEVIGEACGPLIAIDNGGRILVLKADDSQEPSVSVLSYAEQLIVALGQVQAHNPQFETTEDCKKVYCSIGGAQALGADYFEAAMRAYLLSKFSRNEKQRE